MPMNNFGDRIFNYGDGSEWMVSVIGVIKYPVPEII
jgi:hypothetical protein